VQGDTKVSEIYASEKLHDIPEIKTPLDRRRTYELLEYTFELELKSHCHQKLLDELSVDIHRPPSVKFCFAITGFNFCVNKYVTVESQELSS
jgi:hypothetical protein